MDRAADVWGSIYRRDEDVVARKVAGETILVPVKGKLADMQRIFSLNSVGEYIWDALDGERTLAEVRDGLLGEFEVQGPEAEADIVQFIERLSREGLIQAR